MWRYQWRSVTSVRGRLIKKISNTSIFNVFYLITTTYYYYFLLELNISKKFTIEIKINRNFSLGFFLLANASITLSISKLSHSSLSILRRASDDNLDWLHEDLNHVFIRFKQLNDRSSSVEPTGIDKIFLSDNF